MVEIFCGFWSRDSAVGRLHDAMATDPEFAEAVRERNERRRRGVTALIDRIADKAVPPQARKDAVDLIFALTSYPTFASLSAAGRSRDEVCRVGCRGPRHAALGPLFSPVRSALRASKDESATVGPSPLRDALRAPQGEGKSGNISPRP